MSRLVILGAGGHGQVVADILFAARRNGSPESPIGFLDDDPRLSGTTLLGLPVLGTIAHLQQVEHDAVLVAIGDNRTRCRLFQLLREMGARFANAVHPAATIAPDVRLGLGVVICAGVVVGTGSTVADGAILNTSSSVDHHNHIGNCAHICPGAQLGGNVSIGEGATIGIGSTIIPGRSVGDWATVGAGSVVIKDVPSGCIVLGVPARIVKRAVEPEGGHVGRS